ncbi:MAG: TetR/AcrR family transcriptional regulator C-terminal domain-containing protein [Actinomycetota bacterium]
MTTTDDIDRIPLSRERLLVAAVAFADEHGIDAMSMRKLAGSLGYEVMSLYNHVKNKGDLLNGMVEAVSDEVEVPTGDDTDWVAALRTVAVSSRDMFRRHPWAARTFINSGTGPNRLEQMEAVLGVLRRAGFTEAQTCHAYHALMLHMVGHALLAEEFPYDDEELGEAAARFLTTLDTARYPHVTEHIHQHVHPPTGDDFEFGLDLLLDGLSRLLPR